MGSKRGGVMLSIMNGGLGDSTPSVKRRPECLEFRLLTWQSIGVDFERVYYGDELTFELLQKFFIFGNNPIVRYPSLSPGWQYRYDVHSRIFHVLDNMGKETAYPAETLSDLGIVWGILASHQFVLYFSVDEEPPIHSAAVKKNKYSYNSDKQDDAEVPETYRLIRSDENTTGDRLPFDTNARTACVEINEDVCVNRLEQKLPACEPDSILISAPLRENEKDYRFFLTENRRHILVDVKRFKRRNAVVSFLIARILMLAYFASFSLRGKPAYEPWMLYGLWSWLGDVLPFEYPDQIFDLSPNWGD